jgi:hypothetical protein
MKLPHPNPNQDFEEYYDEIGKDGKPFHKYGVRNIDGQQEIVNLETGVSNMKFWKPEPVTNYDGCDHEFVITDMGKREAECRKCSFAMTFHAGMNYFEKDGQGYITIHKHDFPVTSL